MSDRETGLPRPDFFVRLAPPTPSQVFPTYWRFAALRQRIYHDHVAGRRTEVEDSILARHRFTNAYRAADRVSQYLIRHVIYDHPWSAEDLFFRTVVFKLFNKIETWEALRDELGEPRWDAYSFESYDCVLSQRFEAGTGIYSAAYIMPSGQNAFGSPRKHRNHLRLVERMMTERVPERLAQQSDLESVYRLLLSYPCLGPFTAYQYAIDLNYGPLLDFSENDFVQPGPGALDGITKTFSDLGDLTPADVIRYMTDAQEICFERYAPEFLDLWGRSLHLIDCQNLFCEVDKYARVAHPDVAGRSGRTRIKQVYRRSLRPAERPWYPPKWGINDRIVASLG